LSFAPDVTVAAIVERKGRYLMVEELASGRRVFNQPAGHLERNESLVQAAIRETLEETAWRIDIAALVGIYLWESPLDRQTFLRVAFEGRCRDHQPWRGLDEGICRAAWMTYEEILAEEARLRSPLVVRCLDDYLAGTRYPLDLLTHLASAAQSIGYDVSA
jgi:8-oxo-dGTP pyrophosphatase MutT (NUDIX family)